MIFISKASVHVSETERNWKPVNIQLKFFLVVFAPEGSYVVLFEEYENRSIHILTDGNFHDSLCLPDIPMKSKSPTEDKIMSLP